MKKKIIFLLVFIFSFSFLNTNANIKFTDVENHWAKNYIYEIANVGIIKGVGNNKFNPNGQVKVDEFIKMCVCYLGYSFDIEKFQYWAEPFIKKAKELQIITDKEFTNYQRAITREEMASIAINAFSKKNVIPDSNINSEIIKEIKDYPLINDYYKNNALKCYLVGLIVGKPGNLFDPKGISTRAEASVVLAKMLNSKYRKEFTTGVPYTYAYYTDWIDGMGWEETKIKIYAPKNSRGEYVKDPLEIYDFMEQNEKNDNSYWDVRYSPYTKELCASMTPFNYEKWFDMGENDKVFHIDMTVTINTYLFNKSSNKPYNLITYKNYAHAPDDKYYEYLEKHYKNFLDYFFEKLFEKDAEKVKAIFKTSLNNTDDIYTEKTYTFNNRNILFRIKNGCSVYISDKFK